MKKGWETKRLGEIIKLEYGKPLPDSKRDPDGAFPVYGANGEKTRTNEFYHNRRSIIVGRKGSAGEINSTEEKFWPLDVTYFVTFDPKKYDLIFLYHCLETLELTKLAKGVKPGINRNEVYAIPVMVPSLFEQKRIVEFLSKAFAAIDKAKENAEKNLQNSRELFDSTLQTIFAAPWEKQTLDEIADNLDSKRVPVTKSKRNSGIYPYYGASGIVDYVDDYLFDEDLLLISEDGANLLARSTPIAFPVSGKIWVNNHAHILRFKNMVTQKFVEMFFASIKLDEYITGAAQPKLNQTALNSIPIPFPSLPEQKTIVAKLDALSAETKQLEVIYQQKLAELEVLNKSILQKAFNGELTSTQTDNIITFPTSLNGFSPEEAYAGCIAYAARKHFEAANENTFGHVKAEKTAHLTEVIAGFNFGRQPIKDAAGPNDSNQRAKVEALAKSQHYFEFVQRKGKNTDQAYNIRKLKNFDYIADKFGAALGKHKVLVDKVLALLVPLSSQDAELLATVHAAWNNLLIEGKKIDDIAIIREAREDWHTDKLNIPEKRFVWAINCMRKHKFEPQGKGQLIKHKQGKLL